MGFRGVLSEVRAAWWLPLLGLLAGGGAAVAISLLQTPVYTSSTQFFVSTRDATSTAAVFQGSQFSQQRVTSYARLIEGRALAQRVIDRLSIPASPSEVQEAVKASVVADTVLINVEVSDYSPRRAQQIADALGQEFTELASELEATDTADDSPVKVTVTETPGLPDTPTSPKTPLNVVGGALLGLILGTLLAVARSRLDRTVRKPEEASEATGAPLIGLVLRDSALERRHIVERAAGSRSAEDYRQLRNNLQFLSVDEPPKTIMVTSAVPAEGKTTLVVNLALALSDAGKRVTVIEADLRRPKVTRYFDLVSGVGLTNVLTGAAEFEDVVQRYGGSGNGLAVLAAGPLPPNPGELLVSSHMQALLARLRDENDYVLVDAPPLLPVADASGLAVHMDGVLLSVRYGSTRRDQLAQAAATLERVGVRALGVVLNIVPPKAETASTYGHGYGYDYSVQEGDREA